MVPVGVEEKDDVQPLKGEAYPALVALWDNDDDSIYDRDAVAAAAAAADAAALAAGDVEEVIGSRER